MATTGAHMSRYGAGTGRSPSRKPLCVVLASRRACDPVSVRPEGLKPRPPNRAPLIDGGPAAIIARSSSTSLSSSAILGPLRRPATRPALAQGQHRFSPQFHGKGRFALRTWPTAPRLGA
eukprot:671362-Prymnesium_polylepis.1